MAEARPKADVVRLSRWTALLAAAVLGTSLYANIPHALELRSLYGYVPPFIEGSDRQMVTHLGGENLFIAKALNDGRGFADPFQEPTGPTAWMPPVLPAIQAVLLRAFGGVEGAAFCVVVLQNLALIYTGRLVLMAASRSPWRFGPAVALGVFLGGTWYHFHSCYQITHDSWLLMLLVSLMVEASYRLWGRVPGLASVAGWGVLGGVGALSGPVLAPVWGALTLALAFSWRAARPVAVALLAAAVVVAPWAVRNYRTFGRFIPVKSNLFYELYQSNCLEPDGVLRFVTGVNHPYRGDGPERRRYKALGEARYLDGYRERFFAALRDDPAAYLGRVGNRALAATVVYFPFQEDEGGWTLLASYLFHPVPFYGLVLTLLGPGWWRDPLKRIALIVTAAYLLPYVMVAYYERYGLPLLGVQALFVYWGIESVRCRLAAPVSQSASPPPVPETA